MREITYQEQFWKGQFGNEYVGRNADYTNMIAQNVSLFARIVDKVNGISSVIEYGSNIGMNLVALHYLLPKAELAAVEINEVAFSQLSKLEYVKPYNCSLVDFSKNAVYDFAFTKGVLIHLNPDILPQAYDVLFETSKRYILIAEYYNPTPVEIRYRGNSSVLFKRDFAGEMLDRYSDLRLLDFGFTYHRVTPYNDDLNWFLLEKR